MSTPNRPVFRLALRAEPHLTDAAASKSLRAFLKDSLQRWGLRCTIAERVPAASEATSSQDTLGGPSESDSANSTTGEVAP